jgi:hypothetical protein
MRRAAIASIAAWILTAWVFRLHDRRPTNTEIFARATAQRGAWAQVAWIEGPTRVAPHAHVIVARVRVDGLLDRSASRALPGDPRECRLWLEESPETAQAVAACPGYQPIRLTADGTSLPPMGPEARPAILYDHYPLTSLDPKPVMDAVQAHQPPLGHGALALLALFGFLPLALCGLQGMRLARSLGRRPRREGELPGEPARRARAAALRDLGIAAAGLALALAFSAGWV